MKSRLVLGSLVVLCIGVSGCSLLRDSVDNYAACKADSECVAKMQRLYNVSSSIAAAAVPVVPFSIPYSDRLVEVVGLLCATLGGIVYGRKVRKTNSR